MDPSLALPVKRGSVGLHLASTVEFSLVTKAFSGATAKVVGANAAKGTCRSNRTPFATVTARFAPKRQRPWHARTIRVTRRAKCLRTPRTVALAALHGSWAT